MVPVISISKPVGPFVLNNNSIFTQILQLFYSLDVGLDQSHGVLGIVGVICGNVGNGVILGEAGDFAVVMINECWF